MSIQWKKWSSWTKCKLFEQTFHLCGITFRYAKIWNLIYWMTQNRKKNYITYMNKIFLHNKIVWDLFVLILSSMDNSFPEGLTISDCDLTIFIIACYDEQWLKVTLFFSFCLRTLSWTFFENCTNNFTDKNYWFGAINFSF